MCRCRGFLPAADPSSVVGGVWSVQHTTPFASPKLALGPPAAAAHPFAGLRIADTEALNRQPGREPCPVCSRSRKFFCYTCYVPVASLGKVSNLFSWRITKVIWAPCHVMCTAVPIGRHPATPPPPPRVWDNKRGALLVS